MMVVQNDVTESGLPAFSGSPRGWPTGVGWNSVPGAYDPASRTVVIATSGRNPNGSFDLGLHEVGHAYDHALGYASNSAAFMSAYTSDAGNLSGYYGTSTNPGGYLSETFAESFANHYGGNRSYFASLAALNAYWKVNGP
jgi:hypothetical protein